MSWMVFGDMNETIDESERFGERTLTGKRLFLKDFIQQVGAIDLGFSGRKYTWINKQQDLASIQRRLDRALADSEWLNLFPRTQV